MSKKVSKKIYGMVHLSGNEKVLDRAISEIEIFEEEGLSGIIIENYHGSVNDVISVLKNINTKMEVGINILPNEFEKAFEIASEMKVDFIQLDYISGKYKNGKGYKELNKEKYLLLRERNPNVKILGGVWPKYYTPINGSILKNDLEDGMNLCDSIVVTGSGTGLETPIDKIVEFKNIIGNFPLIIGAGLNKNNVTQLHMAEGAIVGSSFKLNSITTNTVERSLVRNFMKSVKELK